MMLRGVLTLLLILLSITSVVYSGYASPVNVRKTIIRELDVLPGCSENTTVTVSLVFDSGFNGSLADYIAFSGDQAVSATVQPSQIVQAGSLIGLVWNKIEVQPGDSLKYSISGKNLFHVKVILEADGKTLQPDCSKGYCYATALRSHLINYTIVVEAIDDLVKKQQLPISISWSVDPLYLYPVKYSDSPQSLRESGTEVAFQWTSFMNESYRLSVVFEIRGENPWGEVLLPAPTVTISLDPRLQSSLIERYRSFTLKLLQENLGNVTSFKENVTRLRDLLYNLSTGFEEEANMLDKAAVQVDEASKAMSNAAAQISNGMEQLSKAKLSLKLGLENASAAVDKARVNLEKIRSNVSNIDLKLVEIITYLNLTGTNLTTKDIHLLLDQAEKNLTLFQSELVKVKSMIEQYSSIEAQLTQAVENMRLASLKLTLMASTLREASGRLRELAKGLRQAAELIDSSLLKVTQLLDSPAYPESFKQYNSTIFAQKTLSRTPGLEVNTELMGDVVYVSLPIVKIKRSEPQISGVSLETPARKIHAYWPLALSVIAAGVYIVMFRRRSWTSEKTSTADLANRIGILKAKLQSIEVRSHG
ncbi:MAG: hypothetical protein ACP5GL_01710 [Infirmifilum sp.]|uniref:hypothetical protein n=1 Tax=Infirmifilum sp. TaxID=2856575 RepID=UPI002357489B